MRSLTLGLFYLIKYTEVVCLTILSGLIINSAIWVIDDIREGNRVASGQQALLVLTCVVIAIIPFHLFYHNLLINGRFYTKMKCVTFGLCFFDCINWTFCYCCLVKPCRDRCFTTWTIAKWVVLGAIMGTTIFMVQELEDAPVVYEGIEGNSTFDWNRSYLDTYLIIFLLQHPIFIIARIPIFILYSILTCCCDKGHDYSEDELFRDRVISFDFISYELGRLNNF